MAELGVVAGAVHRATAGVTEDDDCLRAGLGRGEFKAPQNVVVQDISRDAGAENIADALVENDFIGTARVDAAQDGGEGILTARGLSVLGHEIAVAALAGCESGIAFLQLADGSLGCDGRLGLLRHDHRSGATGEGNGGDDGDDGSGIHSVAGEKKTLLKGAGVAGGA